MTYVSFPGLFERTFGINPVAIPLPIGGGVRWYGLIICLGIILAVISTLRYAKREKISTDDVLDYAIFTVPLAIIGARIYYVLTSPYSYDSFLDAIAIWNGGIAIYGAIIGGAITVILVSLVKKISFLKIGDAIAPGLMLGQAVGRWGNFCNGEAFGHLDRIEFLGKIVETPSFMNDYILRMTVNSNATRGHLLTVHPTFLYESVWNLFGFLILSLIYKKKKFNGQIILSYAAWYGFGRFFIEGLRDDSLLIGNTNIRVSQLLALVSFVLAITLLIFMFVRGKENKEESIEYAKQFTTPEENNTVKANACENSLTSENNIETEEKENGNTD